MDHLQIARELIEIESTTENEAPVAEYLAEKMRGMGLDVRVEDAAPGRPNVMAGPENPTLLFCTHTDTVPPYLPLREDDEYIYGRGACDTKGITACFLAAGARLLEKGITDFGYLFVVGEEVDNVGAIHANRTIRSKYILVGEPTENQLAIGHKGAFAAKIRVKGRACHSAYPEEGDSAVHRLVGYLSKVLEADFGHSDILGPATVNVGEIEGGVAHNVMAPSAKASVMIRVVDDIDVVEKNFFECFTDPETGELDRRVEFDVYLRMLSPKLERIEGLEHIDETIVSYGTDLPSLADIGRPLLCGPGSILDAHTDGEKIRKSDMDIAIDRYVEIAERLIS